MLRRIFNPLPHPQTFLGFVMGLLFLFAVLSSPAWAWTNGDFEAGALTGWNVTLNYANPVTSGGTFPAAVVVPPGAAPNTNGSLCPAPATCLNQIQSGNRAAEI